VLLVLMAGHALRETARDALFLSQLPAERLPWAYLAIALLALAAGLVGRRFVSRVSHRTLLAATLAVGAIVDLAFWWLSSSASTSAPLVLYVWTGLLSTAVTVQFWLHQADVFDVAQAKSGFPLIAAGGLAGAVLGSTAASLLVLALPVRSLLLGSSLLFAAAAFLPFALPGRGREPALADASALAGDSARWRELLASPYLRRVLALVTLTAVLGTGVDFVFKTTVAAEIPAARLGDFFARFSAVTNLGALLFQALAAPALLQALGVTRAVALLPGLLALGAGGVALFGGLGSVLALRGLDATLRHSLHRSATEILHLPVEPALRPAFKTVVDSLGQRGGQCLASLAILVAVAARVEVREIGAALLVIAAGALLCLVGLRRDYVARFRDQLRRLGPEAPASVPQLDLHSLEALLSALSSPNDAEVLTALDLLESYGRTQLVTPLLLHHPSPGVVLRTLDLLAGSDHPHLEGAIEALLSHAHPDVRAAALRAHAARDPDGREIVRLLQEDPSHAVRVAALVAWAGRRHDAARLERLAGEVLERGRQMAKIALARSLADLPYALIESPVQALLAQRDPSLPAELARAACADPTPRRLPLLIALLARREARAAARSALLSLGDTSLLALARAHARPDTPDALRRQLPRTLARLQGALAVAPLVEALEGDDACIRYRALRGLGRMRAHDPTLPVPEAPLRRLAHESLERAITLLHHRAVGAAWEQLDPEAGDELLTGLLAEKTERALERVFRALHVLEPEQEYEILHRALRRGGVEAAGAIEMLEHLVEGPFRDGLLALLLPDAPVEQLRRALSFHAPKGAERLVALLPPAGAGAELDAAARSELLELAREASAAAQDDRDPVLASVARRRHRRWLRRASAAAEGSGDGGG
jgi:AAA family ATP:ADP antiporter